MAGRGLQARLDRAGLRPHVRAMQHHSENPRIARYTPLTDVLERVRSGAETVAPRRPLALHEAVGAVVAEDIRAGGAFPPTPVAYADGWAVNAEELVGATAYSAAILSPPPDWVEADTVMPPGTDAVLPPDAVRVAAPGMVEAESSVAPGEGVRNTGSDVEAGALLVASGTRLRARHVALLAATGVTEVEVRMPRVHLVAASAAAAKQCELARLWLEGSGAEVVLRPVADSREALEAALGVGDADLILCLGGTGQGRTDRAVAALMARGTLDVQGVALRPGGSAAFGKVGAVPVLLLPGRLDALIAGWLALAEPLLAHLSGAAVPVAVRRAPVTEKVASQIGMAEIFLALPAEGGLRPVPLEEAGFAAIAGAEGWFLVPPDLEGFDAGHDVQVQPFSPR
jgi:molybdopterin molybdotransferase